MSLLDSFEPSRGQKAKRPSFVQRRQVPLQPGDVPPDKVYLGVEIGMVSFTGERPKPGEVVTVLFDEGNAMAFAVAAQPERNPIFAGDDCRCRCPGETSGGQIFFLTDAQHTSNLIVLSGDTGAALYFSTLPEVFSAVGVAVDFTTPHVLYILDNRSTTRNLEADSIVSQTASNWYWMLKYNRNSEATGYTFAAAEVMSGFATTDPPASSSSNPLSVIDGAAWITMQNAPARIQRWSGSGFTTLALTQGGSPYARALKGQVVQIPDRPARRDRYYVLGQSGGVWEVIEFDADGVVSSVLTSAEFTSPRALLSVCNRLYVFQATVTSAAVRGGIIQDGGGGNEES